MARANGIETHDTPWVLMELVRKGILQPDDAADALELINNKLNKPREDWKHQIRRWRKGL